MPARAAENSYAKELRKIARHVGQMINAFKPVEDPSVVPALQTMLDKFAEALIPWATQTAGRMLKDVDKRDRAAWTSMSQTMSVELKREIAMAPTGVVMKDLLARQVGLITSLPTEAGQRVHELTIQAIENGTRSAEIAKEIARSGEVTMSRANLIARTEVARTATTLTQARALSIGATQYVWRTSNDSDVRPGHKDMAGKVCEWSDPPAVDEGDGKIMHHHPGSIWNCRCYAEPIIPED